MVKDEQEPPIDRDGSTTRKRDPWFGPNRVGVGFRPYTWQGWLILVVVVAAVVAAVGLLRTGVL